MPTTVLINVAGGTASSDPQIGDKAAEALRAAGIDPDVRLVAGGEIEGQCRAAVEGGEKLLIVGGGDGTISSAAGVLAGSETELGILPLGTLNHFARDLGIPPDLPGAAEVIAHGKARRVDLAEMNGRIFINNSAIGLYPLMVLDRETQQRRLGRSKRLALLIASARTLLRYGHHRLTLTVNDQEARVDTPLLFVGNNDYQLELPGAGKRDALDDGKLCVLVMRSKSRLGFVAAGIRTLVGRSRNDEMVRIDEVERLGVDARRSFLTVSLDGEVSRLAPPLHYSIRKKALSVRALE
ncbi:MAG: diacylglycerol kinase family protein [Sphingomicrobium sp.]